MKRTFATAAAGALALSMVPGVAFADTVEFDEVCENAEEADFPDLGSTHADAISCMTAYDVIEGFNDGTFGTTADISRQQFASLVARFALTAQPDLEVPEGDHPFTDVVSETHGPSIEALYNLDIVEGTTATTFSPNASLTRSQAASIFVRAHEALGVEFNEDATSDFEDLGTTHGMNIEMLVDAGIVEGYNSTTFGYTDPVQRGQTASFLARSAQVLLDNDLWDATLPAPGIGPNLTFTNAPELVSVEKATNEIVRFNFDEDVPGIQAEVENFVLYTPDATVAEPSEISISGSTVIARYTAAEVAGAVRAGVRTGAIADATGLPGIAGDFALTATAVQASAIEPDLITVDNYRFADEIALGEQRVLVDFVFDDPADAVETTVEDALTAGATQDQLFQLYGQNSQEWEALVGEDFIYDHEDGITTVTVAFADDPVDVPQTQLRRGVFRTDELNDPEEIVWSAAFGATGGTTVDPDLVSVQREGNTDVFRFEFDEAVSALAAELDETMFYVASEAFDISEATSVARSAIAEDGARVVRAQFNDLGTDLNDLPVHAFVDAEAVLATDSTDSDNAGYNQPAAAPVTIPVIGDPEPGVTDALDLVEARRIQNVVTGRFSIEFTFDQDDVITPDDHDWELYDANGVRFTVLNTGAGISQTVVDGQTIVTITSANEDISDDNIESTVTVAVQESDGTADPRTMTEGQVDAQELDQE